MSKLSATCLKGRVHVWDLRTSNVKEPYTEWTGNVEKSNHTIWGGRFLHQNKDVLVTLSGSGSVALWKYNYCETAHNKTNKDNVRGKSGKLENIQDFQVSEQPISGFDWSPDKLGLAVSTAFDQKVRLLAFTQLNKL